jgi:hypothetical protein
VCLPLDPAVLAAAEDLARRRGVPRSGVLTAAAAVLLARWSGLREVTVLTQTGAGGTEELRHAHRADEPFGDLVVREAERARPVTGAQAQPHGVGAGRGPRPRTASRSAFDRLGFRVTGEPPADAPPFPPADAHRPADICHLAVDTAEAELVLHYPEGLFDTAVMRLFVHYYGALLAVVTAEPATPVGLCALAAPAAAMRSPRALAALAGALPCAPDAAVTGARIVGETDGEPLPAGLHGRLQLQVRDTSRTRRWTDTGAFGRCTPDGGILLDRTPEAAATVPAAHRRLRADSAADMAGRLAALWAAKLGLSPAEPVDGRTELGGGLPS